MELKVKPGDWSYNKSAKEELEFIFLIYGSYLAATAARFLFVQSV